MNVQTLELPLRLDESGTIRVGGTRVTLDTVVEDYRQGSTPEQIVTHFDTLKLPDVYGAITYYLRNRAEVEEYLRRRGEQAEELRHKIESQPGYRERIERFRERAKKMGLL